MSRKVRLPPPILRLESLSTGAPIDTPLVDDFTGDIIPRVYPEAEHIVPPQAQDVVNAAHVARHQINQLVLQAAGIVPKAERTSAQAQPMQPTLNAPVREPTPQRDMSVREHIHKPKDWRRI